MTGGFPRNGATVQQLLNEVSSFVRRFVVLTDDQACAVALWVVHTWAIDFAFATPYLNIHSPEPRSGKSRLLETLDTLVAKPWLTGGTSKAALVRKIHLTQPTLLLDESDAAFNGSEEYAEALRGVLNNGYTPGKPYTTCIGQGAQIKPYDFNVFCPKAIAGLGKLPDTVVDRSIPIALKRRAPGEWVERFRQRRAADEGAHLANAFRQLRDTDGFAPLDGAEPDLPDELGDRAQDVWEPLFAIGDLAGGGWPERSRDAAIRLSRQADPDDASYGVRLLADCRAAFEGLDVISTSDLLDHLYDLEEAPWGEWEIKPKRLADLLRPYGIKSRGVRVGDRTPKGYRRADFKDAWSRYLALTPPPNATSATTAYSSHKSEVSKRNIDPHVADGKGAENPHSNAVVADVAAEKPIERENAQTDPPDNGRPDDSRIAEMRAMGLDPIEEEER